MGLVKLWNVVLSVSILNMSLVVKAELGITRLPGCRCVHEYLVCVLFLKYVAFVYIIMIPYDQITTGLFFLYQLSPITVLFSFENNQIEILSSFAINIDFLK